MQDKLRDSAFTQSELMEHLRNSNNMFRVFKNGSIHISKKGQHETDNLKDDSRDAKSSNRKSRKQAETVKKSQSIEEKPNTSNFDKATRRFEESKTRKARELELAELNHKIALAKDTPAKVEHRHNKSLKTAILLATTSAMLLFHLYETEKKEQLKEYLKAVLLANGINPHHPDLEKLENKHVKIPQHVLDKLLHKKKGIAS